MRQISQSLCWHTTLSQWSSTGNFCVERGASAAMQLSYGMARICSLARLTSALSQSGRSAGGVVRPHAAEGAAWHPTRPVTQLVSLRAFASHATASATVPEMTGLPLSTERPRLVILGTGWAAARVAMVRAPSNLPLPPRCRLLCMQPPVERCASASYWNLKPTRDLLKPGRR